MNLTGVHLTSEMTAYSAFPREGFGIESSFEGDISGIDLKFFDFPANSESVLIFSISTIAPFQVRDFIIEEGNIINRLEEGDSPNNDTMFSVATNMNLMEFSNWDFKVTTEYASKKGSWVFAKAPSSKSVNP